MKLKPRFHGNGFIQVYLNPRTRLHIWSPCFPATRVQNAQIHDHRFWFESQVLMGELIHTTYDVCTGYSGPNVNDFPHGLWQQGPGHSDNKAGALEKIHTCRVEVTGQERFGEGDIYQFGGPDAFHDTRAADGRLTVTVMTKTAVQDGYRARIVCLNNEEPDHAFEKQPPEVHLRAEVSRVLGMLT